jgi:hypothetical protein
MNREKSWFAMEGASDADELTHYTSEFCASNPNLKFTFVNLMPPVPPTFWDDGHILGFCPNRKTGSPALKNGVENGRNVWMG